MSDLNEKGRYWAGLIYPGDSCPEDWQERMQLSNLQILVSPLHDSSTVLKPFFAWKPRGMARYLNHLENPKKARYASEDVLEFNGADWRAIALPDDKNVEAIAAKHIIADKGVAAYFDLIDIYEQERPDLRGFTIRRTSYCKEVIWSYWNCVGGKNDARRGRVIVPGMR